VYQRSISSERQRRGARLQRSVATGPGLAVSLDFAPALLIGSLRGHLRAGSRTHLRATFRAALAQRPERLVIDTSGLVTYDAAGVAGLVESLEQARFDEVPVAVSSLAPAYEQMLQDVSTRHDLEVRTFSSLDDAVDEMLSGPGAPLPDLDTLLAEVRNLHRALVTRPPIDQSKGVLMVVYGLDAEAAFAMLVWYSRNARLPLHELATRFIRAVRNETPGTLTIGRTDALLADLASQPPERYTAELA
jgi:anti-anti-sigma regulatory factor